MTTSNPAPSAIFLQAWDVEDLNAVRAALQDAVAVWSQA
jgi:hypothetical protein